MKIILLMLLVLNIANAYSMQTIYTNEKVALSKHDEAILRKIAKKINVPFEKIYSNPRRSDHFIVNKRWLITRDKNKNNKIDPEDYSSNEEREPDIFAFDRVGAGYMVNKQGNIWSLTLDQSSFNDFDLLYEFSDLIAFSCFRCEFDKIELKKPTSLRYINLNLAKVKAIGDLSGGKDVSFLSMGYEGASLEGIESLKNIQWLTLDSKNLNSLKPLETLNKLLKLGINIDNNADVGGMPKNLEVLIMRAPKDIGGISAVGKLTRLKYIKMSWLKSKDLNLFKNLRNLETIELRAFKQLESLGGIEGLTKLKKLDVSSTKIASMKPVSKLENLEYLKIYNSKIEVIEGLENKKHLKVVDLGKSLIGKIQGLDSVPKLKVLDLALTNITKIEGLENTLCLEDLNLSVNNIIKFENLTHLPLLSELYIRKTGIKKFPGWQDMKRLRAISMNHEGSSYAYVTNKEFDTKLGRTLKINDEERKQYGCL
jgi:internalin A